MKRLKMFLTGLLLVFASTALYAQTEIAGTVTDEAGEPVIGATVVVKGSTNGTITDLDGNFRLSVEDGAMLIISYIGYQQTEVAAANNIKVTLKEDLAEIDEIVVTGYTVQKKADLTGSVSVVKTDDIKNSSDSDPMRALQGKVAGVTITADGSPMGAGTVRIRGVGSFNSSQDPLFVIDGVPTTTNLNHTLNAQDIESMQVLKDAASASIYGSRAANGVIIITTKKGKKSDHPRIDFAANLTAQVYNKQTMMKLSNTTEYATAMAQAALNDGLDPVAYAANYGLDLNAANGIQISAFNNATMQTETYTVNGLYDGFMNANKTMKFSDTDWLKEISRMGFSQNYDLSVSNGNDNYTALFSVGYKNNQGILKYTDFENISARINTSFNLGKYVTIGENFTLTHTSQCGLSPMENALKMSPTLPVYEEDGETFSGPVGGMSDRQNPMRELYMNRDNDLKIMRLFGNGYIDIKPIKGLVLRSNFGLDYDYGFIHSVNHTFHSDVVNNSTPSTNVSGADNTQWTLSNTANYNFDIAEKHNFNVLAGMELFKQRRNDFAAYAEMFDIENYEYMWPNAATGTTRGTGIAEGYNLVSFFGKLDYNYDDLVLASFTIRRDGSSRFGSENRYGVFPAATLGYRLSKHFDIAWLNDLKIRASWGKTGNQAISNTARFGLYVADYGSDRNMSAAYDLMLQGSGIFPSGFRAVQTENPKLKWETTIQYNAGIDFSLFNSDFYGTYDIYIKKVEDMLINPAYLGAMGEGGAAWLNGPNLENRGMELSLGYRHNYKNHFGYDFTLNADFYRSKVTYLPETTTGSYVHTTRENLVESERPYGSIVGHVVDGLYQTREEVLASGQENARLGGLKYRDIDGNGVINGDDRTWIFNPVPDFAWSFNAAFNYKDFDLTLYFQGLCGVDVYNDQKFQTDFYSLTDAGSNKGNRMLGAWNLSNTGSDIPMLTTNNTGDEGRASSYFVEHGSWFKLRTLQIGYNVPKTLLSRVKLSNARVYLSGNNLFTAKSKAFTVSDPENPNWAYPHYTSFSFGLQVGF